MNEDICSQFGISCQDAAPALKASLLDVAGLSELFKAMADETRIKILYLLAQRELCVCDLAFLLESTLPAISPHLRFLRTLNLCGREGTANRCSTRSPTAMSWSCCRRRGTTTSRRLEHKG